MPAQVNVQDLAKLLELLIINHHARLTLEELELAHKLSFRNGLNLAAESFALQIRRRNEITHVIQQRPERETDTRNDT